MKENLVVDVRNVSKKYGKKKVLDEVNLKVAKGDIYGLVGNNGAGKSTLLKIITGIEESYSGEFSLLKASDRKEYYEVRKYIGALIEEPGFYTGLSVKDNLEYYRIQRGIPNSKRVDEVIDMMGLADDKKKKFGKLSLGKKQRLGIALALLSEPQLLILDEPINGLDPQAIMDFRNLMLKLNREKGVTIIISSHILAELENMATKYGFIKEGQLVEEITSEQLKEKCKKYINIKVDNTEVYVKELESTLECNDYKVMPDNSIRIYTDIENMTKYSDLASKCGVGIQEFGIKEADLESYYMKVMGKNE